MSTANIDPNKGDLFEFLCRMGDNTLVLGHRVSEWCGHAPVLEEDIALANTALDLIGQTTLWLDLAGKVEDAGRDADRGGAERDAQLAISLGWIGRSIDQAGWYGHNRTDHNGRYEVELSGLLAPCAPLEIQPYATCIALCAKCGGCG